MKDITNKTITVLDARCNNTYGRSSSIVGQQFVIGQLIADYGDRMFFETTYKLQAWRVCFYTHTNTITLDCIDNPRAKSIDVIKFEVK